MAFNTSIVGATASNGQPDLVQFSADWLTTLHVNTVLRVYDTAASVYRYAVIKEVKNARLVRVGWDGDPPPLNVATPLWEEEAFSWARGWPRSVCVFQQRLVIGGSRDAGNMLYMSRAGQFRNFDLGTGKDNEAIALSAAGGVRTIRHVVPGANLTIFTDDGVSVLEVDSNKTVTPSTVKLKSIAPFGTHNVTPGQFDSGMLMVTVAGNAVRDIAYSAEADNIAASPVSLAATGFLGTVVDSTYLSGSNDRPEQLAFFVNDAGGISLFHSVREQKIGSWFQWTTYGAWTSITVAGQKVFAVCWRPNSYRLELMDLDVPFDAASIFGPQSAAAAIPCPQLPVGILGHAIDSAGDYLGSGITFNAGGVTPTVVGVTRQQGTNKDLGTGSGIVGIAYGWWIDPLPPAIDLPDGTTLERSQRLLSTSLLLYQSQSATIDGDSLILRTDGLTAGAVPAGVSRWFRVKHLGWSRANGDNALSTRRITRNVPLPVAVLGMVREVKV